MAVAVDRGHDRDNSACLCELLWCGLLSWDGSDGQHL